ncbi:hypothetical protein OBBRIDRAFT_840177 [Obba rivulosa]|uniref:Protein kinase domain-containing protein n=1 Tax=Obba rivulosa TaxID=1052685 RepID=A0A8E2ANF9_9APHY|nr:hypothetical protein OBBRIDRAFT_840177 [Obba rivulosa]
MDLNIMMDLKPLYPNLFHPVAQDFNRDYKGQASHHTRTKRPVKYFFIDFGISRKYDVGQEAPLEPPIFGGDKSVPEFQMSIDPVNPFPTDIYYLGNMIREEFLNSTSGLEFMQPLVADMVRKDPTQRPTINEVAARFDELRANLSSQVLRSRLVYLDENELAHAYYNVRHFFRTIYYVLARYPAVPTPSP